jgi:two-component system OmpR family response regulator
MTWKEPKILIIDDDKEYANIVKSYFVDNQFNDVISFHNVMDCMNTLDKRPDVIFVNYRLNNIEGVRAARMLNRKFSRARIVIMKSSEKAKQRVNKRKYGIDAMIEESTDLIQFIKEVNYHKTNTIRKKIVNGLFVLLSIIGIILFIF